MPKTVGYMLTWTTYGTWLQGGKKGFVKDGEVRGENVALKMDCEEKLKGTPVRLRRKEKEIVREVIVEAARRLIRSCGYHRRDEELKDIEGRM